MHPKFKFQNGGRIWKCSLKQSCRVWKVEQLSFLEIFNFFRKFMSNLQIKRSGNSVNNAKIKIKPNATSRLAAGATRMSPPSVLRRFLARWHAATNSCQREAEGGHGHAWKTGERTPVVGRWSCYCSEELQNCQWVHFANYSQIF